MTCLPSSNLTTVALFPTTVNHFDAYKRLNILQPSFAAVGQEGFVDRIWATPAVNGHGRLNNVPAHFDTVLIRVEDELINESTKGTCLEGAQS